MARPKRTDTAVDLQQHIKTTALRQIARYGAAALSLRAIARELKITAPAIYNYYPNRDALVTALIIDAFQSFGDSQLVACNAIAASDLVGQLLAIGLAYRSWALAHPQHYQLIFGTLIPGYGAPAEHVRPLGMRSMSALVSVMQNLHQARRLKAEDVPLLQPECFQSYGAAQQPIRDQDFLPVSVAILIWSRVHGLVSLELNGSIPPFGTQGDALYRYELQVICQQFIKED